jgi:hypothetical protein
MRDEQHERARNEHRHADHDTTRTSDAGDDLGPLFDDLGVRRFEERMAGRDAPPLISGLTEHLVDAGADPTDVVDDDEVLEEVGRLQTLAATARHHLWRRHRG